jgi:uncharacterized SAM-binding protein YcdF (DUF218 family)
MIRAGLRVLGALVVVSFALFGFTPLSGQLADSFGAPARLEPADAIVVLGAGADRLGVLGDASLRRAVHGIELWRQGLAPRLLMLGPPEVAGVPTEAALRERLAIAMGVPASAVSALPDGLTTREEARVVSAALGPARRVILVTGAQHLVRAAAVFERAGLSVRPAPVPDTWPAAEGPAGRLETAGTVAREALARAYYRAFGYLR